MGGQLEDDTVHPFANKPDLHPTLPPIFQRPVESKTSGESKAPPPWSTAGAPPWSTATRPLSDIRELTEPSLADLTNRAYNLDRRPSVKRHGSLSRKGSTGRQGSLSRKNSLQGSVRHGRQGSRSTKVADLQTSPQLATAEQTDASSAYSLPLHDVPARAKSKVGKKPQRKASVTREKQPTMPTPPPPRGLGYTIPNHGRSISPIKMFNDEDEDLRDSMHSRLPSRTFLRSSDPNYDILDFPKHPHPRITIELHASASLFVGGGSVEGTVRLVIDDLERVRHRRQLAISRISIDLIGVEEMSSFRRNIFLNLATELIDSDNPPPHNMVESLKQISPIDPFWLLAPSVSQLPFLISLPLDVGPPPFHSKTARVRYVLCATALIRDQGKQYLVRCSQEVSVLSVYDPEKALMSLPSPLTASDEYIRHRDHGLETIKVTAGLHRQVWVSGTSIFVDVQIINRSKKTIKRLELQLERDVLCYKHVAASTAEKSASQARIFDSNDRAILSKSVMKQGTQGWAGVSEHTSDTRTCDLELPRGHATVKCGKFFEVRYFLNIVVSASRSKTITVQLPIVLIHMNSLDVVPNSVAQVAAAIEEKRARVKHKRDHSNRPVPHGGNTTQLTAGSTVNSGSPRLGRQPSTSANTVQGRAFAAPRKQSLDRMRQEVQELQELGNLLNNSPRKYLHSPGQRVAAAQYHPTPSGSDGYNYHTPPSNRKGRVLSDDVGEEVENIRARLRRMRSTDTHRSNASHAHSTGPQSSKKDAGLQRNRSFQSSKYSKDVGFREIERGDFGSSPPPPTTHGPPAATTGNGSEDQGMRKSRFDGLSAGSARRKMRSSERWKGGGWFGGERRESRDRGDDKQRALSNWI